MFQKKSLDVCQALTKAKYTIYENDKILITRQYSEPHMTKVTGVHALIIK